MNEIIKIDWEDIHYTIDVEPGDHSMSFKVFGKDDINKVFLNGFVKWDGCWNWAINNQKDGMMTHFCSRESTENFGILLNRIYKLAESYCYHWDGD